MMQDRRALEAQLAELFHFQGAVLTGRGRAALCALLEEVAVGKPVLFPANICSSVLVAIVEAGAVPVAVPVSAETGLPSEAAWREALDRAPVGVWMISHLYGFVADASAMVDAYRLKGWFILENDANAVRPTFDPGFRPDASLVSFGYAKVISAGGGGGLLSDDAQLIDALRDRLAHYPDLSREMEALEGDVMLARRALRNGHTPARSSLSNLEQIVAAERTLVRARWAGEWGQQAASRLAEALRGYGVEVARRCAVKALWDAALHDLEDDIVPVAHPQPVPWRLIRIVRRRRGALLEALRAHGIDAGANYGSLIKEVPSGWVDLPDEDPWGECVLNLWLDQGYTAERIESAANIMRGQLAR